MRVLLIEDDPMIGQGLSKALGAEGMSVDWVRDGTVSPVSAGHARHVIDIIESTYRSAATGSTVELTTSFDWVGQPA